MLDFDLGSLFKKKDSSGPDGKSGDKTPIDKTVIKRAIIVSVLFVIVFGAYFFLLKPVLNKQENQIIQAAEWKKQIQSCKSEIINLKESIGVLKSESTLKGGLFVSSDEFENFYAELTEATINSGLRILDITRGAEIPVRLSNDGTEESSYSYTPVSVNVPCEKGSIYASNGSSQELGFVEADCEGEQCAPIAYYKMTVSYKIDGSFGNYLQFRNILANKEKIVNIELEDIKKTDDGSGRVTAIATVSLVKNIK